VVDFLGGERVDNREVMEYQMNNFKLQLREAGGNASGVQ